MDSISHSTNTLTYTMEEMLWSFNTTFNNISVILVVVGFIGGGNRSIQRKSQICRKSLTNFITYDVASSTPHHKQNSHPQH